MTDITAKLDAIEAGLEGVTPGPWSWGQRWYTGHKIGALMGEWPVLDLGGAGVSVINAAHIASLYPDTVRELVRLARIGAETEARRAALEDKP
jgi:hypothetical protein